MQKRKMESSAPSNVPPARQDVLSSLPDDILCHILSFLPTSQAMSTSVLSRRWRHLWKSVPSLDLRYEDFRRGTQPEFCWFVRQMLSMRDPAACPRWFHLRWREGGLAHHPQNIQFATSWVDRAMLTQGGDGNALLRRLELHLFSFIRFPLERILRSAAHVEHLSLATSDHCFCPVFERPPLLPKLRSLHLRRFGSAEAAPILVPVSVGSTMSLHRLITDHCPTLEDLTLEDCSLRRLRIVAPRLVRLAVVPDQPEWKGIDVEAPRLRSVRYTAMWRQKPWRLRLATRLVDASVHATFLGSAGLRRLADALDEGIRTLRSLELGFVESAMEPQQEEYPVFQNLKTLKLAIHFTEKTTQATVIFLLSHMPTLETLEIDYKEECGRPSQVEEFIKILKSSSKLPERVIVRQGGPLTRY